MVSIHIDGTACFSLNLKIYGTLKVDEQICSPSADIGYLICHAKCSVHLPGTTFRNNISVWFGEHK